MALPSPRARIRTNLAWLVLVQFGRYLLPLLLVPYLARVLGPASFGRVAFALAYSTYLTILIEYGFTLSGTRDLAQASGERATIQRIVHQILSGRLVMFVGAVVISVGAAFAVATFRDHQALLWLALTYGAATAFMPYWYFQGQERLRSLSLIDLVAKLTTVPIVVIWVRKSTDDWHVLALMSLTALTAAVLGHLLVYRETTFERPSLQAGLAGLRTGWTVFLFRASVSLYTSGNSFLVGLFAPSAAVAYYAGAERVVSAGAQSFYPVTQALLPRLSDLVEHDFRAAVKLARQALAANTLAGVLLSSALWLASAPIVSVLLGSGYSSSVQVLQTLSPLPALIAVSNVLGLQWMLSLRLDRYLNVIVLTAGLFNIVAGSLLVSRYGVLGMAWSVLAAETVVVLGIFATLAYLGVNPVVGIRSPRT